MKRQRCGCVTCPDRGCRGREGLGTRQEGQLMCASCGCPELYQRHEEGDITIDDLTAAGAAHGLSIEQVAENIVKAVARENDPTQA